MKNISLLLVFLTACGENQTPWIAESSTSPSLCLPNLDQQLTASEFPLIQEGKAEYWVSSSKTIDYQIGETEAGLPVWDFQGEEEVDTLSSFGATKRNNQWFLSAFPSGEWIIPNDAEGKTVGVYSFDDSALWLLGIASSEEEPAEGQTLLVYDTPVALLYFPMVEGDRFVQESDIVDGISNGLPFVGTHRYDVEVKRLGKLMLKDISFSEALRVNTTFTVEPNIGASFLVRQSSFFTECFGEVVRLESEINVADFSFSTVQSMRRFAIFGE